MNTKTQVWLEYGEIIIDDSMGQPSKIACHNIELDCGGDTFEEAVIIMANNVYHNEHYRAMLQNADQVD